MLRSLSSIVLAIQIASPTTSKPTATNYARIIQQEAHKRDFDPFTLVAIVHNESRWHPRVVDGSNCVGFGQVCLSNYRVCQKNLHSEACQTIKSNLQNGAYNLRVVSGLITKNREFCRKKTGKPALWRYWLASYGGRNKPSKNIWCGQQLVKGKWVDLPIPKGMWSVMNYRRMLIKKVRKR